MSKEFTQEEVKTHNKENNAWIIIRENVYDISKFINLHPAGKNILLPYLGKDCTEIFSYFHDEQEVLQKYQKLQIGKLKSFEKKTEKIPALLMGDNIFGDGVPFSEPNYLQGWHSPYFNKSHHELRKAVRQFVKTELTPYSVEWDENYALPKEIIQKIAQLNYYALVVGKPWPSQYFPEKKVFGVSLENPDSFHEAIISDEIGRTGVSGVGAGIWTGQAVGIPPILYYGTKQLQDKIAYPCLKGEKLICLAITEPWAGSDVAAIQTKAIKSECGKYYIVNGMKKWITNGIWCDYFTTAVRTSDNGMAGISLLVIGKDMEGFSARSVKCQGIWASGTSFLVFDNVKVPVENLIGEENQGFKYIMINFNHERLGIAMGGIRRARICLEDAFKFAHKRKTFGKRLIDHPLIRNKLANMAKEVEATQAYLDQCLYNFDQMPNKQKNILLSPSIALLKAQIGKTLDFCAKEAVQIFGGLGYTRGGQGGRVERIYREVKGTTVPGGSEEIMLDLAIRMSSKLMPSI